MQQYYYSLDVPFGYRWQLTRMSGKSTLHSLYNNTSWAHSANPVHVIVCYCILLLVGRLGYLHLKLWAMSSLSVASLFWAMLVGVHRVTLKNHA